MPPQLFDLKYEQLDFTNKVRCPLCGHLISDHGNSGYATCASVGCLLLDFDCPLTQWQIFELYHEHDIRMLRDNVKVLTEAVSKLTECVDDSNGVLRLVDASIDLIRAILEQHLNHHA